MIEVSAAVNDGNQGGALTNSQGQLLGLVSLGLSKDRKMGTAIPVHLILEDLKFPLALQTTAWKTPKAFAGDKPPQPPVKG